MSVDPSHDVTQLLCAWAGGDSQALAKLIPLVHDQLRRMASRYMAREQAGDILQATALVNEAYLRLVKVNDVRWQDRAHFFAISAQIMRRILVEAARGRSRDKRGGGIEKVPHEEAFVASQKEDRGLVALDDALHALAKKDARKAQVVELRFFGGLTEAQIAEVLKVSTDTVKRDWSFARLWLAHEIQSAGGHGP